MHKVETAGDCYIVAAGVLDMDEVGNSEVGAGWVQGRCEAGVGEVRGRCTASSRYGWSGQGNQLRGAYRLYDNTTKSCSKITLSQYLLHSLTDQGIA